MWMKLTGALLVVLALMSGIGYWYYKDTQDTIAVLNKNIATVTIALEKNEEAVDSLQEDYNLIQSTNDKLNFELVATRRQNQVLADKLARHDIGTLASQKPELVERIINRASKKSGRCLELLSGAILTEEERNAKSPKDFNSECPWLFDSYSIGLQ